MHVWFLLNCFISPVFDVSFFVFVCPLLLPCVSAFSSCGPGTTPRRYGDRGIPPRIPACAELKFDIEVVEAPTGSCYGSGGDPSAWNKVYQFFEQQSPSGGGGGLPVPPGSGHTAARGPDLKHTA